MRYDKGRVYNHDDDGGGGDDDDADDDRVTGNEGKSQIPLR